MNTARLLTNYISTVETPLPKSVPPVPVSPMREQITAAVCNAIKMRISVSIFRVNILKLNTGETIFP